MKAKGSTRLLLALTACLTAAGCRTAGVAPSRRPPPPAAEPRTSFRIDEFVQEHNRNARLIRTVKAKPSISVTMASPEGGKPFEGGVSGRLFVAQPYDFKLVAAHQVAGQFADIGSNKDEFWFWWKDNPDKQIFRCSYGDVAKSDLAPTFQPDWIVSAMGLKPISRDEAATVQILPGTKPGTTVLRFAPSKDPSSSYVREMVVDDAQNRMTSFRVYDHDAKKVIGEATIQAYRAVAVTAEASADSKAPASPATCYIPDKLKLEWKPEQLTLDIAMSSLMSSPSVNEAFSGNLLAGFVPPTVEGYESVDIAQLSRNRPRGELPSPDDELSVRESLAAPASEPAPSRRRASSNGGVTLGAPVEIQGARLQSPDEFEPAPRSRPSARPASQRSSAPRSIAPTSGSPLILPVLEDPIGAAAPRPRAQTASAAELMPSFPYER